MTAGSIAVPTIIPLRAPVAGKLKHVIDINTAVELRTETVGAEIFFTIDGSKPNPFAAVGADRSTIKYTKPFKLREGKRTIKAMAVSRDGTRESHVVSKAFEVERGESNENYEKTRTRSDYEFIDELEKERKKEIIKKRGILKKIVDTNTLNSFRSDGGSLSDNESSRYHKDTRFLGQRFATKAIPFSEFNQSFNKSSTFHHDDSTVSRKYALPDSSIQALRLQRETDFLKCIYCFAARPQDPQARYCTECGKNLPQIPQLKMIPPEPGQMGTCFYCKSYVPFNTTICVICENPINPQLQPQATIKLQGKIICTNCTMANPASYNTCVACDNKLVPGAKIHDVDLASTVPQHAVPAGKSMTCNQCFRLNRSDARFCDWCGAKPQKQVGPISCSKCGASNNPYAKYCIACSAAIQPPSYHNPNALVLASSSQPGWLSQIDSKAMQILNKQYSTISTQTYGLYYTSAKAIENNTEKALKQETTDRKSAPLTAVSAGRGYWRQQMDHICAHLKAYVQNTPEFRAVVGEPRLGKLNSAKVEIDSSWCTIIATFPIRNNSTKDGFDSSAKIDSALKTTSYFSQADYDRMAAVVAGRDSSLEEDSISENDSENSERNRKPRRRKRVDKNEDKLSGEDRQLIKELGRNGRGRPKEVDFLLREGANPNAITSDGLSLLHSAIRNKHFEAIQVLIDAGADIKAKIPPKGNTVLHEAVLLGSEADIVLNMLLRNGASPEWKNSKNETPFDLAIKENNTAAINILGAQVGDSMIKTYLRSGSAGIRP